MKHEARSEDMTTIVIDVYGHAGDERCTFG